MPFLDRDGIRIYFEQSGTGPAVLLTHGYSASARMWRSQIQALSDRYHLIAWDMRGHDRSDYPDDPALYSHEATVGDMAAILDACGVQKAVIGGLSLGGFMTLAFNLAFPQRVNALMVFDCGPGYKKDAPRAQWNQTAMELANALERNGLAAASTSAEAQVAQPSQRPGAGSRGAWDAYSEGLPRDRFPAVDPGPNAGAVGSRGPTISRVHRLHGGENPRRREGHPQRRGTRGEYRSARSVQRRGPRFSRAYHGLRTLAPGCVIHC